MVVASLVVVCSCGLILTFAYGRDQGIYALVARTVLDGGMPYRDAWDFKPPGIYLVYAFARAVFGSAHWGIRVLEVGGLVATVCGLALMAKRWWGDHRIGVLAGALVALVHVQLDFWHTAQPETFGGMLTIAGVVVGTGGSSRHRTGWRYIIAGLLFGSAGLLKPPLAGGGAVLAFWAAWEALGQPAARLSRRIAFGWRAALRPILLVLIGGAMPFAICLGWFGAKGAMAALYETLFVFTPHYTALGWHDNMLLSLCYRAVAQWLVHFSSLMAAGLLLSLACWRSLRCRRNVGLLLGIIAMQLLGVALQGKFFPYHYAALWPITAMVAALGWWKLWRYTVDNRGRVAVAVLSVGALVVASMRTATKDVPGSFWQRSLRRARVMLIDRGDQEVLDNLATVADVDAKGNRDVAAELRRRVPADGVVYIWGFEPVIYDLAERAFASRYIYNVPQRVDWAAERTRHELLADLHSRPPDVMVIADADVFPMVTGNAIGSREIMEKHFPELRTFVESGYGKVKRVQDFDIWVKR